MGLDQYIYRVTKTHYDKRHTFYHSEFDSHTIIPADEIDLPMYVGIKPYCQKLKVLNEYYDVAQMLADHDLDDTAYIYRYTANGITIGNDQKQVDIDHETIRSKYTVRKVEAEYVCHIEEVYSWRKAYDVQEWFGEHIDGGVVNCGFYPLSPESLAAFVKRFPEATIPYVLQDANSTLAYHEWY